MLEIRAYEDPEKGGWKLRERQRGSRPAALHCSRPSSSASSGGTRSSALMRPRRRIPDAVAFRFVVTASVIERLREATEALNDGDPGPFASMFAEDAEWRGMPRGHLWWKRTPS